MVPTWKPALEMISYKPFCCGPALEPLFASHLHGEQLNASTGFFERSFFDGGGGRPGLCLQGVEDGETSAGQVFYGILIFGRVSTKKRTKNKRMFLLVLLAPK